MDNSPDTINMADLSYPDADDMDLTSTAVSSPTDSHQSEQPGKKKRKAWGQPIPDFKVVLPPRKRAKTAEEKEQRKNERVIRNRKAADKSRQRQKAAVAELECKTTRMEAELAHLRAALTQYQSAFGVLPGTDVSFSTPAATPEPTKISTSSSLEHHPSPSLAASVDVDVLRGSVPATPFTFNDLPQLSPDDTTSFTTTSPCPTLTVDSPNVPLSVKQSPPLAPTLFPAQDPSSIPELEQNDPLLEFTHFNDVSGMTQYPAAILCDPQCQPATSMESSSREAVTKFNLSLHLMNLTFLMTIYETFSTSMLFPMCQIFRTLAESLSTSSFEQDWMDRHFPLIHSLITTPSSKTTRPIFRMKLLSRLLACSPSTARLLKAATNRALQRLVDDEAILHDTEGGRQWASLLATKWAIQRLEQEHQRYRLVVDGPRQQDQPIPEVVRQIGLIKKLDGVDYRAVERSLWRWRSENKMEWAAPGVY